MGAVAAEASVYARSGISYDSPPRMPLSAGQIVNGKYRILRPLGDGGMGSVYEAFHEVLGTRVALKLLHAEFSRTGVAKRFLQEARASARIKSQHVVGVSDADQTPDGQAFIVLEYIEGKTLRELYAELAAAHRSLGYDEALDFAIQMFEGVEAAHAAGIVHRDLKPDNVMITADQKGQPLLKVLDFGIAKVDEPPESAGPALTRPGALLGTPEYMAPEQVYSAGSADVRSDVFALGIILFEMLTGRRPVLSDDPQQIAVSYLTGAFTRLDEVCPDAPPALCVAVHRAFAAQPRDRFATVAEMRAAIEPFAPIRAASTARASLVAPPTAAGSGANGQASLAARGIPETRKYAAPGSTPPPAPSGPAPSVVVPSSGAPLGATPGGTHFMPQSIAAPSPAFQPEYPAAIAPSALLPVLAPSDRFGDRSSQPDRVSVEPSSRLPYGAPPPQATSWAPPPAQAAPNRTLLFVAIGVGTVVLLVIIVLGILYYEGVFDDDDPAPVPHKSQPSKRHHPPPPAPAPRGGGSLR